MSARLSRTAKPIAAAFGLVILVAALGGLATKIGPWYYALHKPSWQPPDWLFGPVWTLIFGLAGLAGVLAWRKAAPGGPRMRILLAFAVNMALNTGWSLLFFRLERPDWALIEVGFLWASIILLMMVLWSFSQMGSWLLTPYLLWVSFAAFLNLVIVRLNAPFVS